MPSSPSPTSFGFPKAFRSWLAGNHRTATELFLLCSKTSAPRKDLTYREALDEALCFGWIDGVRHAAGQFRFCVRFSPRKTGEQLEQDQCCPGGGADQGALVSAYQYILDHERQGGAGSTS